jgi:dipeptidyl aminopeptidase/acylaminoacyl peptidase
MMKKYLITNFLLLMTVVTASSQVKTTITQFNLSGPYPVAKPFATDTVNVKGEKFEDKTLMNSISLTSPATTTFDGQVLPSLSDTKSVGLLSFYVNNRDFLKGKIEVKGPKHYKLFVDGTPAAPEVKLAPEHHTIAIQYLTEPKDTDSIRVVIDASQTVAYTLDRRHPFMVHDIIDGKRVRDISVSADGQYVCVAWQTTARGGSNRWNYELREVKTGRVLMQPQRQAHWLPKTIAWLEEEQEGDKRVLYKVDPTNGSRSRFAYDIPKGSYTIAPTEDYLILNIEEEGPKEDREIFEVLEMDDRQPGWRNRRYLAKYDIKTGITQRITFGSKGEFLQDISQDGRQLLIGSSYSRLAMRPTEVSDVFVMDAQTLKVDTLIKGEGFLGSGTFSPDGKQILFKGSPEAFDRIGCTLPASVTPNMYDYQLYLYDIATKRVIPLTRDFNPSVQTVDWAWGDGLVYFTAEDRDFVRLYQMNPASGQIVQLEHGGDNVSRMSVAAHANVVGYISGATSAYASAFVAYTAKGKAPMKQICLYDGKTQMDDLMVGECKDWNYTNAKGETVYGRLYLPQDFDPAKQYPMIVYYYGGCSPVSRYFDGVYSGHYWASLGYVAYILQPSGASGFSQEWGSRHVNTAGRGPAEDIIEGVKQICKAHPFINPKKIGCMGASYGGFMTQYLQTQTDIFAAAISHAGITNHTSYWGEGYWGYNYSEVSMANSYPWSHRQLYVDQSPLFNADKIHTPLLLLHGNADTNVPLIESLQMFTALKLLGREVALVEVEGENHHILNYSKKEKWLATQMAWFARWLKDDPTWWDTLYPKKHL